MKLIKKYSKHIFLFICMFILLENVSAAGFASNIDQKYVICNGTDIPYGIPYIVHNIVNIIKVGIPIILIILGMIDFLKAVVASDEKQMKDAQATFIRRLIAAILIFFVFAIVQFVFSLIDDDGAFGCANCLINKECGTVHTYENTTTTNTNTNNNQDKITFNLNLLEGEKYASILRTYTSYKEGTYICKDNIVSQIGKLYSSAEQCLSFIGMSDAYGNCMATTQPYYETENKKVTSCNDLCKQYPDDIECID